MNEETGPEPEIQRVEGFPLPEPEQTTVGTEPLRPAEMIRLPAKKNPVLQQLLANINADEDLHTLWRCQNINAVDRLGMSDHGPIHMQIVVNISLRILRMLLAAGLVPAVVTNHHLTNEDAEVVVALASLLHDVGMSIDRVNHEEMGIFLAHGKAMELLDGIYPTVPKRVIVSETLHAILNHRSDGHPQTLEAGTVRLVGTDRQRICQAAAELLDCEMAYQRMSFAHNPYGDGKASDKIVDILRKTICN